MRPRTAKVLTTALVVAAVTVAVGASVAELTGSLDCRLGLGSTEACGLPAAYDSRAWSVPECGPGATTFDEIGFAYSYEGCGSPGGDSLPVNGSEPSGVTYHLSFEDAPNVHPAVIREYSPDGVFGFEWTVGVPSVTLRVLSN
ncbi:MAG TPA: hypothetical protein VN864_03885 [Thermoplasmata archaeon]|nr:hypothetical protein [Thermoplasmata archaeon]